MAEHRFDVCLLDTHKSEKLLEALFRFLFLPPEGVNGQDVSRRRPCHHGLLRCFLEGFPLLVRAVDLRHPDKEHSCLPGGDGNRLLDAKNSRASLALGQNWHTSASMNFLASPTRPGTLCEVVVLPGTMSSTLYCLPDPTIIVCATLASEDVHKMTASRILSALRASSA